MREPDARMGGRWNGGERWGRPSQLNPADPFIVRGAGHGPRPVEDMTAEQRRVLRQIREAGGVLPRRKLRPDVLAGLLRTRMVGLYADRVELTMLGTLALTAPPPAN